MGLKSKNRKEWYLTHLANMHQKVTSVAFYDTLGPDATKFMLQQTELSTMSLSLDCMSKMCKMKIEANA